MPGHKPTPSVWRKRLKQRPFEIKEHFKATLRYYSRQQEVKPEKKSFLAHGLSVSLSFSLILQRQWSQRSPLTTAPTRTCSTTPTTPSPLPTWTWRWPSIDSRSRRLAAARPRPHPCWSVGKEKNVNDVLLRLLLLCTDAMVLILIKCSSESSVTL